jgi:hypothetical protein
VCAWINKEIPREQRRYVSPAIMGNKLGVMRKKARRQRDTVILGREIGGAKTHGCMN